MIRSRHRRGKAHVDDRQHRPVTRRRSHAPWPNSCQLIEKREPRIELIRDQSLYPPMRHPADFTGDPRFSRTPSQQRAFEEMLDSADALYGIPDVDPAALKRTADANPDLRWVHTMAAGGGGQVKAAGLIPRSCSGSCSAPPPGCTAGRSRSSPCSACWPAPRISRDCSHSSATTPGAGVGRCARSLR